MRALISGATVLALMLAGCASTPSRRHGYPTQEDLQALAATPKPQGVFSSEVLDVSRWDLEEPFAERIELEPVHPTGPFAAVVDEVVAAAAVQVIPTRAMQCAAQEIGRFYLEHDAQPSETLREFIFARCGAVGQQVRPGYLHGEVAAKIPDGRLVSDWSASVRKLLASMTPHPVNAVGLWFGRNDKRAVVVALSGEVRAHIEPFATAPDEQGRVIIRGRLHFQSETVYGLINHGRYGFESCVADSRVPLPEFALACTMQSGDALARLTVGAVPPERLLGKSVLDVLVRRTPNAGARYQQEHYVSGQTASDDDAFQARALKLVNRVRREAGLEAVLLAHEESATARDLAPHFFAASLRGDPERETDVIALGLVAGWEVQEVVRRGWFIATWVAPTDDMGLWLSAVLSRPHGRQVLLAPEARRLALGPLVYRDPPVLSALLTAYALFPEGGDEEATQQVLARIGAERELRGLPAPRKLRGIGTEVTTHAALISQQGYSPMGALRDLLEVSVDVLNRSVRGVVLEANDLDDLPLADDLFKRDLELDLAVTHYQPEDHPWGRYVVLVLIGGPKAMAQAEGLTPAAGP